MSNTAEVYNDNTWEPIHIYYFCCLVTAQDHYLVETILAFNTNDNNTLQ